MSAGNMDSVSIRSMEDNPPRMIPIDQIVVVHSRSRQKKQFQENVRSIDQMGLYKPILLNKRNFAKLGKYELICGEGRLMAHKALGKTEIAAFIVDEDQRLALLQTLSENIVRSRGDSIEFARSLKKMNDDGMALSQLARITGRTEEYLRKYLQLMENGEERLIKGVEDGIFPLTFALNAAQTSDRSVQHLLMDAFDNNIVTTANLRRVRRIIEDRLEKGKGLTGGKRAQAPYTVDKLKGDIRQITRQKEAFVYEAGQKENRIFRLLMALRQLRGDEKFVTLVKSEGVAEEPQLKGSYAV